MNFELVVNSDLELIETPVWDYRKKGIYWTDLFSGDVHFFEPQSGADKVWKTGKMIGSAIPTTDENRILCALEDGLYLLNLESSRMEFLVNPEPGRDENRFNDTRVDAKGRVYMSSVSKKYGTPDYTPDMTGGFYMVDTDGSVHVIEESINQYNAIVWNHDNTRMFVVDTWGECLRMYPYDLQQGITGPSEIVIRFDEQGMPDGMSIDAEDNLYICHWTKQISVWNKNFTLIQNLAIPVEYACCTGFGGDDLQDVYLATSKYCYGEEELKKNIGAGGLFRARSTKKGTMDHYYPITK